MKAPSLLLAATFLLLPWCMVSLFAQQQSGTEKKITITKRSVDSDGSEVTETIVKKGKAAENFDVDQYIRENRSDKTQVEVTVSEGNDNVTNRNFNFNFDGQWNNITTTICDDKSAFLGVEEDSDENEQEPGLVVQIVKGSAAETAGLRHNDKILKLNDSKINEWNDLTKFIQAAKPGDAIKVTYSRNGKESVADVKLTTRKEIKCEVKSEPKAFMGVSDEDENGDEPGVAVSITNNSGAEKAGLQDGDVIFKLNDTPIADFEDISDFMAYAKPGEKVLVTYERDGKRKTVETVLGEQKAYNFNFDNGNLDIPGVNLKGLGSNLACTIKEKEACLGVYSNTGEQDGATVQNFTDESAAREAGMQEGDRILSINGNKVNGHSELWDEIAKYKKGDQVEVAYDRDGKSIQVKATLKACKDNLNQVQIWDEDNDENRKFYLWNWGDSDDRRRFRESRVIIIRRAGDSDAPKLNVTPSAQPAQNRSSLNLTNFKAYPNPSQGQITVEFKGEPVSTVVSLFDMSGRQLFREELNAFNGEYNQQFDLTAYAKGTIVIQVQQGDKVFSDQILLN
ncbi:MAG: PDZ domain-containing protein [Saprospiraceae bacterium]|nr:PDZ domain-containing protein [Saprospiraceae bacterium]